MRKFLDEPVEWYLAGQGDWVRPGKQLLYPGSKKHRTEASIRVPRMFNHTHSNNMINR
jgi:hypothetical protein